MKVIVNGEPRHIDERATLASLLEQLEFAAKHFAVEVNFEVVPRREHTEYLLQDGDRLEIVSLVGGG